MNDKKPLEIYNYLIKVLSLTKLYTLDLDNKDKIVNEIEKISMDTLNYFENVSFNRPNYFYKDYIPSPLVKILLLISNNKNEYLFKKEDNGDLYLPLYFIPDINLKLNDSINKYVNDNKLNDISINDLSLKIIKSRTPLENKNNYNYPLSEYILIFYYLDKNNKLKLSSDYSYLDIDSTKIKEKELTKEEFNEFITHLKNSKIYIN